MIRRAPFWSVNLIGQRDYVLPKLPRSGLEWQEDICDVIPVQLAMTDATSFSASRKAQARAVLRPIWWGLKSGAVALYQRRKTNRLSV
jgi:hypothetical protein